MSYPLAHVVSRWDATLASILTQFDAVLAHAMTTSEPLLATIRDSIAPLERIWSPVQAQLHRCTDQVSEAWDAAGDELSEVDGLPDEAMWAEGCKRDATSTELEIRHGRARAATFARAAVAMHAAAQGSGDPGQMRIFAATGGVLLAEHAAIENWAAMLVAKNQIHAYRDKRAVPLELLGYYEAVANNYWRIRESVQAEHEPALRSYLQVKLERHAKDVHKFLRGFPQYRRSVAS